MINTVVLCTPFISLVIATSFNVHNRFLCMLSVFCLLFILQKNIWLIALQSKTELQYHCFFAEKSPRAIQADAYTTMK